MTNPARQASAGVRHYALGVLLVVYTFNFVDRQILSVLLQSIKLDLGVSDTALGFLSGAAFALFYATLGVPIAVYADRANRRNLIATALAVWSAMTALCGLAQNFWQLAAARVGVGIGEAGCSPPAHSLLADYFPPERRATALSIYSLGIPLGIMFGLLAGGWLDEFFGWRRTLLIVGLPGLVLAVIVRFTVQEPARGLSEQRVPKTSYYSFSKTFRYLAGNPAFVHLALGTGLASMAGYSVITWFPSFMARSHGMSSGEIGTWLGLMLGIPGGIGIFLGGYLSDRLGAYDSRWCMWIVVVAFVLSVPAIALTFLTDSKMIMVAAFCLPALLTNCYQAIGFAQTQNLAPVAMRSTASAFLLFGTNIIGLGIGPMLSGFASDKLQSTLGDESLRYVLLSSTVVYLWSAVHFYKAGSALPAALSRVAQVDEASAAKD